MTAENFIDKLERDFPSESYSRIEDSQFKSTLDTIIKEAENRRLHFMEKYRRREMFTAGMGLFIIVLGAAGFGWFLLVETDIIKAVSCMVLAACLPLLLQIWDDAPLKQYKRDYKDNFMPQMAKALGGFKFHPARGIGAKVLPKTGIIPSFGRYEAEDCFMGTHHGVKVIFSEAKLYSKKKKSRRVFDGLFVLLELSDHILEGHTIITADHAMVDHYVSTRWRNLSRVNIQTPNPEWDKFAVFSDKPESAALLAGEKLLKELSEASKIFDSSPLSAVFFGKKYIFISIPYDKDMFEASNIYFPVATQDHAMTCKKEIEQILEIIDVFEIYKTKPKTV